MKAEQIQQRLIVLCRLWIRTRWLLRSSKTVGICSDGYLYLFIPSQRRDVKQRWISSHVGFSRYDDRRSGSSSIDMGDLQLQNFRLRPGQMGKYEWCDTFVSQLRIAMEIGIFNILGFK